MSRYQRVRLVLMILVSFGTLPAPAQAVGTLLVQKEVLEDEGDPNNPNQTFELDVLNENGVGIAGATVMAGDNPVGLGFEPGSYGVAEVDLADGWTLDGISCESDNDTSTFGDFAPGTLSLDVELADEDRVVCTFTNSFRSGGGGFPEPIPAVGPIGMGLLASLLAGVGVFRLRRRKG